MPSILDRLYTKWRAAHTAGDVEAAYDLLLAIMFVSVMETGALDAH